MARRVKPLGKYAEEALKEDFLILLDRNYGFIEPTKLSLNITKHYWEKWKFDPAFQQHLLDIPKMRVNSVEKKLFELIDKLDRESIKFYLKTHSPDYQDIQKVEQNVSFTDPLVMNVIVPQPPMLKNGEQKKIEE